MEQRTAPAIGGGDLEALLTVRRANVEDTPSDRAGPVNADRSVCVGNREAEKDYVAKPDGRPIG
jgi:hypothetical protein